MLVRYTETYGVLEVPVPLEFMAYPGYRFGPGVAW